VELNPERYADPAAVRFEAPGAYAQALPGLHTWMLDWAFEPEADDGAAAEVLRAALAHVGDEPLQVWTRNPTDRHDRLAADAGLPTRRDLYELRVPLPLDQPVPDLHWRPFVVGQDEAAWLEVNNLAFGDHPEQGGWSIEQIHHGETEAWFDPEIFVVVELDGRMAGFCWSKVHTDHDPRLGEIYVIATHPDVGERQRGVTEWRHVRQPE
jgi:mycothiol synthase